MSYLAIAYPKISNSDYDWIQSIRIEHDLRYVDIVKPHVTLVFSTNKLSASGLADHVRNKLAGLKPFKINFNSTKIVEDDSKTFFHAFLIPSDGFEQIDKIHDLLYRDALTSELRLDIPFIPHLGIGTGSEKEMADLKNRLDSRQFSIEGSIDTISIVEYDGNKVEDLIEVALS